MSGVGHSQSPIYYGGQIDVHRGLIEIAGIVVIAPTTISLGLERHYKLD